MKEHLKFAGKVLIALIIINAVLDLVPTLAGYIAHPLASLGLSKSTAA